VNKFIVDGKVAVLYSPGWGAGWWTWNTDNTECLFDTEIVQMVIDGASHKEIEKIAKEKWPKGYWGGADDLTVEWLPIGQRFMIEEYDGNESLRYAEGDWITA
jgi:hypothetical protein